MKRIVAMAILSLAAIFVAAIYLYGPHFGKAEPGSTFSESGEVWQGENATKPGAAEMDYWIYGITVDDGWYDDVEVKDVFAAIRDMTVKPTVRVVMSREIPVADYQDLFAQIHEIAYVMACPVDSSDMGFYPDEATYLERFQDAYHSLAPYTDLWEIGNEINGVDWIGQEPELIVTKVAAANAFIRAQGGKTALTMYYARPEDQDMFQWMEENLSESIAGNVDFAFISYYEDDNESYQPDWKLVFPAFERAFPEAKVGFGECGNTAEDATEVSKLQMACFYYAMELPSERYVGGCFWWYWAQDCVPHERNAVYDGINRWMTEVKCSF